MSTATEDRHTAEAWRAFTEALPPIGDRLLAEMPDSDDPQLRAEFQRFMTAQLSAYYIGRLYADPNYPDFWPFVQQAFNTFAPNPDAIYYIAPIDGRGVHRVSGVRGTVRVADFQPAGGTLYPTGVGQPGPTYANYNLHDLSDTGDGRFSVILSPERPEGYDGDWWELDERATCIIVRMFASDWDRETDYRLAIERLDLPAIKPRPTAEEIEEHLRALPQCVEDWTRASLGWIEKLRSQGLINKVDVHDLNDFGGLTQQYYIEGLFELEEDEALIWETELPETCHYWNLQLTDALWSTIDWQNRQTSLNGDQARIDSDGKVRLVISAKDPGVPNWLDTAGYRVGAFLGRWTDASDGPTPQLTKVPLADVRSHLPEDTPKMSAEEREKVLRWRRECVQLRVRW